MDIREIVITHYSARTGLTPNPRRMKRMLKRLEAKTTAEQLAHALDLYVCRQTEMSVKTRKLIALFLTLESGRGGTRKRGRRPRAPQILELAA